jgi:hypothetical protein
MEKTWSGIQKQEKAKFKFYEREHFAPLLLLALIGLYFCFRTERRSYLGFTFVLVWLGLFSVVWWPLWSYPAPLLVSFFGLAFLGIRYLGTVRVRKFNLGRYWARGLVLAAMLAVLINVPHDILKASRIHYPLPWNENRERIIHQLEVEGGDDLVLVRYAPSHDPAQEWVYNSPDIDSQKVIFARALGADKDCDLVHYYYNRNIWFLEVGSALWPQLQSADSLIAYCNASPILRATLIVPGELP